MAHFFLKKRPYKIDINWREPAFIRSEFVLCGHAPKFENEGLKSNNSHLEAANYIFSFCDR